MGWNAMDKPVDHAVFQAVSAAITVELADLKLSYGSRNNNGTFALHIERLHIRAGTIHCIYGTNGCGKTSLLKILAGVAPLINGTIRWNGLQQPTPGSDFVLVTQAGPWPHWSVWQNVCEPQLEAGVAREQAESRARSVIELLGLSGLEGRYAHQLSAGQQQRTVLARAIALSPKILMLDEIMSGQSEYWTERIAGVLRSFTAHGGMVIMVSHDPEWVMAHADRVTHIVSRLGDAVSSTHFYCGYDGDGNAWPEFRQQRIMEAVGIVT